MLLVAGHVCSTLCRAYSKSTPTHPTCFTLSLSLSLSHTHTHTCLDARWLGLGVVTALASPEGTCPLASSLQEKRAACRAVSVSALCHATVLCDCKCRFGKLLCCGLQVSCGQLLSATCLHLERRCLSWLCISKAPVSCRSTRVNKLWQQKLSLLSQQKLCLLSQQKLTLVAARES